MASYKLASDDDNTDFVGAKNPDDSLFVRFESKPYLLKAQSDEKGMPVYEMRDYITIQPPGNELLKVFSLVDETHKQRFPRQWAHYQNTRQNAPVEGWALETWPRINAAQVEMLKYQKFFTVEQFAAAPFGIVQNLGMGFVELQEVAKKDLETASKKSDINQHAAELQKRDDQIAELQAQMAQLIAKIEDKPKRGRPKAE